ncbi:MAG: hypothetical protein HW419_2078 [Deltaproteobacteria bacterium]|nr:hypothetical protein [Deltaproteobacteria bacterium]
MPRANRHFLLGPTGTSLSTTTKSNFYYGVDYASDNDALTLDNATSWEKMLKLLRHIVVRPGAGPTKNLSYVRA